VSGELVFWKCNVDLRFIPVNFCSYMSGNRGGGLLTNNWTRGILIFNGVIGFFYNGFGVPEIPFYSVASPIPVVKSRER
jgi:hypothetical protein